MMRNVVGRTIDIVPMMAIMLAQVYFDFPFSWLLILIPCWIVFRIWWFYRRAVDQGLFDD